MNKNKRGTIILTSVRSELMLSEDEGKYNKVGNKCLDNICKRVMPTVAKNFLFGLGIAATIYTYSGFCYYGYKFSQYPEFRCAGQLMNEYHSQGKDFLKDCSKESKPYAENLLLYTQLYYFSIFSTMVGALLDANNNRILKKYE